MNQDQGASAKADRAATPSEPSPAVSGKAGIPCARPTTRDPAVRETAIRQLAEDCAKWADDKPEDWIDSLSGLYLNGNGYELARDLERRARIDPDAELVEILDGASHYLWTAERAAVKAWVEANGIQPPLAVGTRVSCSRGVGEITSIREEEAAYTVLPDDERNDPKYQHGGGWIIKYDDVTVEQVSA